MAESQSMTTADVVAKTLITEHADFLREAGRARWLGAWPGQGGAQEDLRLRRPGAQLRLGEVLERFRSPLPTVAELLEAAAGPALCAAVARREAI